MNVKKTHQHNSKADKCIKESQMEEGYYDYCNEETNN